MLQRGGLAYIGHAKDTKYEDTFVFGPELIKDVQRKVEIMRAHWLDVQEYLAPPHK